MGTGIHTEPTPIALFTIHNNNPILSLDDGFRGTTSDAERVITVNAQGREIIQMELVADPPRSEGHHPAPLWTGFINEVVFLPARNLTGMAANTAIQYDEHPSVRQIHLFLFTPSENSAVDGGDAKKCSFLIPDGV